MMPAATEGITLGAGTSNQDLFEKDLLPVFHLSKEGRIRKNGSNDRHRTGGPDLISPAYWGVPEEDAEGMSCGPVPQFPC